MQLESLRDYLQQQIKIRENLLSEILSGKIYSDVDVEGKKLLMSVVKGGIAAYRDSLGKV